MRELKRTTCLLAQTMEDLTDRKRPLFESFISEKLDGVRCLWDGGITRGMLMKDVPWANTEFAKGDQINMPVTGLWSRGWKPIFAPDWFLDKLPTFPLDGELWIARNMFQKTVSIVRSHDHPDWQLIKYVVYGSFTENMFRDGEVEIRRGAKITKIKLEGAQNFLTQRGFESLGHLRFSEWYIKMSGLLPILKPADCEAKPYLLHQTTLSNLRKDAECEVKIFYDNVLAKGGEGVMIRKARSYYSCTRSWDLMKVKPWLDSEAIVVGYTTGRKTDHGSRLLGKMGALIVEWEGKHFKLSGFTDNERELSDSIWARENPDEVCPEQVVAKHFPRGKEVCFRYRELTKDGIPKEARYDREHTI